MSILERNEINPLQTEKIGKLILRYALPAIIGSLVNSLYNIVDQIFVGNSVGELGNAATNVSFPLVMVVTTLAMTFGVGGASAFSLHLGRGDSEQAKSIVGNSLMLLLLSGILTSAVSQAFLRPLLIAFGGRGQTLEYAVEYTRITAVGIPLALFSSGASQLIRADGSPKYAMACNLIGAILNCFLDPLFIFGFDMGMSGAASATVIGQAVSATLAVLYFWNFKVRKLKPRDLCLRRESVFDIVSLGIAAGANQLAVTVVQIVMNNSIGHYGELSIYGRDIPLACVGIITKVNSIFSSVIFGIAQSTQPIIGYNYGAGDYARVKQTFKQAAKIVFGISSLAFLCFQLFPRQITSIFGQGNALLYEFAEKYFRIFLFCVFAVGLQILCAQFFPSIGKGGIGTVVSLSRQVFFLVPMVLIFPLLWGIDGILLAGPIADGTATVMALLLVHREMKNGK